MAVDDQAAKKPRKQPYYITRRDGQPFSFAGLWECWHGELLTCTIITTEASEPVRALHDRQPMMLDEGGISQWLDGGDPVLSETDTAQIQYWPVTMEMNKPGFNKRDGIDPVAADQI